MRLPPIRRVTRSHDKHWGHVRRFEQQDQTAAHRNGKCWHRRWKHLVWKFIFHLKPWSPFSHSSTSNDKSKTTRPDCLLNVAMNSDGSLSMWLFTFFTIASSPPRWIARTGVVNLIVHARCIVLTLVFDAEVGNCIKIKWRTFNSVKTNFSCHSALNIQVSVVLTFCSHVTAS